MSRTRLRTFVVCGVFAAFVATAFADTYATLTNPGYYRQSEDDSGGAPWWGSFTVPTNPGAINRYRVKFWKYDPVFGEGYHAQLLSGGPSGSVIYDSSPSDTWGEDRTEYFTAGSGTTWTMYFDVWSGGLGYVEYEGVPITSPVHGTRTNANGVTVAGRGQPGQSIYVVDASNGNQQLCTSTVDANGYWSCATPTLSEASHNIVAYPWSIGNGVYSQITVTFDRTINAAITVPVNGTDYVGQAGTSGAGYTGPPLTFSGTKDSDTDVVIKLDGNTLTCTGQAAGSTSYSCTVPYYGDGTHTVTLSGSDGVNTISRSSTFTSRTSTALAITSPVDNSLFNGSVPSLTITGTKTSTSTVTVVVNGTTACSGIGANSATWTCNTAMPDSGNNTLLSFTATATATEANLTASQSLTLRSDRRTSVTLATIPSPVQTTTPTFSGTGEAGATLSLVIDGGTAKTTTVAANGNWTFTWPTSLSEGSHVLAVTATDSPAGNTASIPNTSFTINTGTNIAFTSPVNGARLRNYPAYTGTAEAGATVSLYLDGSGSALCSTVATGGTWSCAATVLAEGGHTIRADVFDGFFSQSDTRSFTIDRTTTVAITAPTGTVGSGTVTVTGTGEAGAAISVSVDGGSAISGVVGAGGTWSVSVPGVVADGSHTLSVTATETLDDGGQNQATATGAFSVNTGTYVTITAPANQTYSTPPNYSGTGEPGATITLTIGASTICTQVVPASGLWTCSGGGLVDGTYTLIASIADGMYTETAQVSFTLDRATNVAITAPTGTISNSQPTVTGTAENGAAVSITITRGGTQVATGSVNANGAGAWSWPVPSTLTDATYVVSVSSMDALNNVATDSATFTVNTGTFHTVTAPTNGSISGTTPAFSGTAEANADVTVTVGGSSCTAHATGGNWSCTPSPALAHGSYTATVVATDGQFSSTPTTVMFQVDRQTSVAITAPAGTVGTARPTVTGTGEPGATIGVRVDSLPQLTTTVSAGGTWTVTLGSDLADGPHVVVANAVDAYSNTASDTSNFSVNTGTSLTVDVPIGGQTYAATPTYSGTAEVNDVVTVKVGAEELCSTQATSTGAWSCTGRELGHGTFTVAVHATDGTFGADVSRTFSVDRQTNVAITSPTGSTLVRTPTVSGTGEAGASVSLSISGTTYGPVTVSAGGTWTLVVSNALADGDYVFTANATDTFLNTASAQVNVRVNAGTDITLDSPLTGTLHRTVPTFSGTAELGVAISVAVDGTTQCTTTANPSTGAWSCTATMPIADGSHSVLATATDGPQTDTASATFTLDRTTSVAITAPVGTIANTSPTIQGTGEPNAQVVVTLNGASLGTVSVAANGQWSIAVTSTLVDGPYSVLANATDAAGNQAAGTRDFTVNTSVPSLAINAPADGSFLSARRPTISGVADVGATVNVTLDGVAVASVMADAGGAWSYVPTSDLAIGAHTAGASTMNAAGTTATASSTFTVDVSGPVVTILSPAASSVVADARAQVKGSTEADRDLELLVDGTIVAIGRSGTDGTFTLVPGADLAAGTHTATVRATDLAGNVGSASVTFTIDLATTVAITSPVGTSTTSSPTISGTGEPGASVLVSVGGSGYGPTTVLANGTWSVTIAASLPEGDQTFTATATDTFGHTATAMATIRINASTFVTITAPVDGSIHRTLPRFEGKAEGGVLVVVQLDGAEACRTNANAAGDWACVSATAVADGVHDVVAVATDGTQSASDQASFTLDRGTMVTIDSPAALTPNHRPPLQGTGEPGATVQLVLDGSVLTSVTVPVNGHWSFALANDLADGAHSLDAHATDLAGNQATASKLFTIDSSVPLVEIEIPLDGSVSANVRPAIQGRADAGAAVSVKVDNQPATTVTTDAFGTWAFTLSADLTEGTHTVRALTMNAAGTTAQDLSTFRIDLAAPVVDILAPSDGAVLTNVRPSFTGTTEPLATVVLVIDGQTAATSTAAADGTFTLVPAADLAEGVRMITVTATDGAGNSGSDSESITIDLHTTLVITSPAAGSSVGAVRPSILGTAEAGASLSVLVDGIDLGTITVPAGGAWTITPTFDLADGSHTIEAVSTDLVGNTATATVTFSVDSSLRDTDGDGIPDPVERPNGVDVDTDHDGRFDWNDTDDDGDGLLTQLERPDSLDVDTDGDTKPNHLDSDDDGDGVPTPRELRDGMPFDTDSDGAVDHLDADDDGDSAPTMTERPGDVDVDTDGDAIADYLDVDDDDDGVASLVENHDATTFGDDADGDGELNVHDTDADGDLVNDGREGTDDDDGDGTPNYLDAARALRGGALCSASPGTGGRPGLPLALLAMVAALALARRRRRAIVASLVTATALGATVAADAQSTMLDTYQAAESSRDGFATPTPYVPRAHLRLGAQIHLDYARNPLQLEAGSGSSTTTVATVVGSELVAHLVGSLSLRGRVLLYAGMPVVLVMSGDSASQLGGYPAADGPGVGDPFVGARVRLVDGERFQLGLQGRFALPVGHWAGGHYSGAPTLSGGLDLLVAATIGALRIGGSLGARAQGQSDFAGQNVGSSLTFSGWGAYALADDRVEVRIEALGVSDLQRMGSRAATSFEVLAGAKYFAGDGLTFGAAMGPGLSRGLGTPDFRAVAMLGFEQPAPPPPPPPPPDFDADDDGVDDATDQCPNDAEDLDGRGDEDGCPDLDDDGDGVPDAVDGAPTEAEDRDGFEDHDGVPELDDDHDGILDAVDRCPQSAEDRDEIEDTDGCPEDDVDSDGVSDSRDHCPFVPGVDDPRFPDCRGCPELACVTADGSIQIHHRIEFELGTDRISASSSPVLEAVRAIMSDTPSIRRVRIEGHTDNSGNDRRNMDLSRRRSASIGRWLVEHGIAAERLDMFGCGENVALRSNDTEDGRQQNRRVEFIIVDPAPVGRPHDITDRCTAAD